MATVKISEVNLIKDYAELKNNSSDSVNLLGWKLIDTTPINQKRHKFVFSDVKINANSTLKIWSGIGKNNVLNIYQNRKAAIWNNSGDVAELYDSSGNLIDKKIVGKSNASTYGTVDGFVRDAQTKEPIVGATVSGEAQIQATTTGDGGHYNLELVATPAGTKRNITASADNYSDQTKSATVFANKITNLDFDLPSGAEKENIVINISVGAVEKPDKAYWKEKYNIKIEFQNNSSRINYFESHLFENNAETDDYITGSVAGSYVNNTIDAVYQIPVKNWNWYELSLNTLGFVKIKRVGSKYNYGVTYFGKQGRISGKMEGPTQIGQVNVIVSQNKRDAAEGYNFAYKTFLAATAAAAVNFAAPPIAAIYLTIAAAATIAMIAEKQTMDDPLKYDGNFKKAFKVKTTKLLKAKTHVAHLANTVFEISDLINAHRITNNRRYTAKMRGAKQYEKIHAKNLIKIKTLLHKSRKKLQLFRKLRHEVMTAKDFHKLQLSIKRNGLPKNIVRNLTARKIPKQYINFAEKALPTLPNEKQYRDINLTLHKTIISLKKLINFVVRM